MVTSSIDIIIPVYNAYDDLKNCVDSVLRTVELPHHVILIDDCSPDERIQSYFSQLTKLDDPRLTLLFNDQNLGFVRTVNRGMSLDKNDVVLLNSDTIVTTNWLGKLIQCARFHENIGTITPFSNNAEICSFPGFCKDNKLVDLVNIEVINEAIETASVPTYPDIPTAVGFCMYIRRELIDAIGLFDAETFRLGYGEENDFCRRAEQAGWRNVLCDDTFIAHVGSSSFTSAKQELAAENLQKLLAKHPDYQEVVSAFILADPIKPIRQLAQTHVGLNLAADNVAPDGASQSVPGILHIMHGSSGGTEQHIRSLMQGTRLQMSINQTSDPSETTGLSGEHRNPSAGAAQSNITPPHSRHYLLTAVDNKWTLSDPNFGDEVTYQFQRQPDQLWADFLNQICATFQINFCHVHHVANCRLGILAACADLDIPYGISVHDHYLACPTINMLDNSGFYCSAQTDLEKCQNCLAKQDDFTEFNIRTWREENAAFISGARMIIGPSHWATDTLTRYFDTPDSYVIPHGVDTPVKLIDLPRMLDLQEDDRISIGILGAIGPVKGARQLERLVEETRTRNLPIRWVVIGYTDRQNAQLQSEDGVFCVHGAYESQQMHMLLEHYQIKLAVFPSAGPETYCYTLTEAWSAGIPALVPPIGALQERVSESGAGWMMSDWQNVDAILENILDIVNDGNAAEYSRKSKLALNVKPSSIQDMVMATASVYENIVSINDKVNTPGFDNTTLLQVLIQNVEPEPGSEHAVVGSAIPPSTAPPSSARSSKIGRLSFYLRHTIFGRLGALILPVRLKELMKGWILGERR